MLDFYYRSMDLEKRNTPLVISAERNVTFGAHFRGSGGSPDAVNVISVAQRSTNKTRRIGGSEILRNFPDESYD